MEAFDIIALMVIVGMLSIPLAMLRRHGERLRQQAAALRARRERMARSGRHDPEFIEALQDYRRPW